MQRTDVAGGAAEAAEIGAGDGAATLSAVRTTPPISVGDEHDVAPGQQIGHYQIRRLLGRGGMGRVYLARDAKLGRSVALKLVAGRGGTSGSVDEARAIAMLNHPNIVQLYELGDHAGQSFLALEYVEGDTLRDRLRAGPLALDEALHYTRAIADALAHAHAHVAPDGSAQGVLHCDLKPSNVMVGRDGRVRVVDFGIARTSDDALDTGSGTSDWMAPEQWFAAPLSDRVDVWALAVVCVQLVTGEHPLGDDPDARRMLVRDADRPIELALDLARFPPPIAALIARSLVRDPAARPTAAAWARTLDDVLTGRAELSDDDAPYPGLAAFDEQHAAWFFGREREVDEFLERLRDVSCLPIVGPSGAGKSSFLHAGVIPRLRKREPWTIIALRPGDDPVGALAHAVVAAAGPPADHDLARRSQLRAESLALCDELLDRPGRLAARLATVATARNARVLLAVDQLEEVFTQCAVEAERAAFLTMLLGATDDVLDPVRVVFTVRDDFVGRIAGLRSLFVVRKLAADDLRRTITGPLARRGYELDDPRLIDDLVAEVGSAEVADLPLLQFACRTLWDGRDAAGCRLRRATYVEMGGLAGALARHAERALAELTPQERPVARLVLLQLVAGSTRRAVSRDQLTAVIGEAAAPVIDRLLAARLVGVRVQGDSDAALVEIAHESLLQSWSKLARWVDETRDERRLLDELNDAAARWERRSRRDDDTWAAADLATARHRARQLALTLPAPLEAFLAAGEQRHRAQHRRRRIRLGMAIAAAGLVALVAFTLVAKYFAREQLIRTNVGTIELELAPFDWDDGAPRPAPVGELPQLAWWLYGAQRGNPHEPGAPLPADVVDVELAESTATRRTWRVRAPGGTAFLQVHGRHRAGEHCEASWIRIQAIPGYATSQTIERLTITVPTCQASRAGMIEIEAGPFLYGGPGITPSRFYGKPDYTEPEREVTLPTFWMDRTEVSNAAYAPFAELEDLTGYARPIYDVTDPTHRNDAAADHPTTNIDAYRAAAFCRYMGKQLSGDLEWVKAARGGVRLHGAPNPAPRRQFPWGTVGAPGCVNQQGGEDGAAWTAPVSSYPCGAGPYGHLNLVGNVDEWIARDKQLDRGSPLHVIRGGSVISPAALEHTSTTFRNHRDPNRFDYAVGHR
jgi:eukaryotic-like serine/threonine-protein kinase